MNGKRCHARGTPIGIVPDPRPSAALANPGSRTLPSARPADRTGIPIPPHRKVPEPVGGRTPAASTPR